MNFFGVSKDAENTNIPTDVPFQKGKVMGCSSRHWHFAGQTVDVKVLAIDLPALQRFLSTTSIFFCSGLFVVGFQGGL